MKKLIILMLLFLTAVITAQIKGTTQIGRLVPKPETPVTISILTPRIKENDTWKCLQNSVTVEGKWEGKVDKITVNGLESVLLYNNHFTCQLPVPAGKTPVTVAVSFEGKAAAEFKFIIEFAGDITPPLLTILEPVISSGQILEVSDQMISIRGEAVDTGGIKEVRINNLPATMISAKDFFKNLQLTEGENKIVVQAVDKSGNTAEKTITIKMTGDRKGPAIVVLEPAVSRGIKAVSKKELITVRGVASDESGVEEVIINQRKALLNTTGEFSLEVALIAGDNRIIIQSRDKKQNISTDTFIVNRTIEDLITPGKYYALVIGIDKYSGSWPALRNAVNDAKAVSDILNTNYRFNEIFTLYDNEATRRKIIEKFEMLVSKLGKEDNLLIFYSGHGEFKPELNKGYWVPVDAQTKSTSDYISNSDIQTFLNGIRSRHTLLVSDACFSGDIFRGGATQELPFENTDRYFKEVYRRPSRYALTSGGMEPVMDGGREGHSVFTYYFLDKLRNNASKYFTAGQLFQEIQIPVTNNSEQSPIFQPIKGVGDEGGQFIFIKK